MNTSHESLYLSLFPPALLSLLLQWSVSYRLIDSSIYLPQEAYSQFQDSKTSQYRRCRHLLENDEREREITIRTLGTVPFAFQFVVLVFMFCLVYWISWQAVLPVCVMVLKSEYSNAVVSGDSVLESAYFTAAMGAFVVYTTFQSFQALFGVVRKSGVLDLSLANSNEEAMKRCGFAVYSYVAAKRGWLLPLQRVITPLHAKCYAQVRAFGARL